MIIRYAIDNRKQKGNENILKCNNDVSYGFFYRAVSSTALNNIA